MAYYYAQIDASNACYAVTQTAGEIIDSTMIPISSYDISFIGKIWTFDHWENPSFDDPISS